MKAAAAALLLALTACGERAAPGNDHAERPDLERTDTAPTAEVTPVQTGEAGPSFSACQANGTPRLEAGSDGALPVRVAPFEGAGINGRIASGTRFFVCTRSIDQRWMGIVYDEAGALSPVCGVSAPVARRADYAGPCRSGWVASASVRLVAG